ncbi:hypothetical protein [Coxiella-like endosymbiont]|uniref:hypothetical protein n=1 Tax=Coxiella-like endosymbiont TaxID=1592897 RepID=UPI000C7FA03F|nr:hypothetical protein [Coxiella-like endosymbiont]PMB54969.1 hypothetical protein CLERM_808 [Coxiella-like endosymbiont]PMB55018.1 hypothetical protein CLERM_146 [Coxiella-like endosymbiont]
MTENGTTTIKTLLLREPNSIKKTIDQDISTLSENTSIEVTKLSEELDQLKIDVGNLSPLLSQEFSETTPEKTESIPPLTHLP